MRSPAERRAAALVCRRNARDRRPRGRRALLLLGADGYGRDLFSRLVHGARLTLALALLSTLGATLLGRCSGRLGAMPGGRLDALLMRSSEFILVLPAIYVVLALRAALPLVVPPSVTFFALAGIFTLFGWPIVARGVRAIVLSEGQREYVQAARAMGAGPGRSSPCTCCRPRWATWRRRPRC